MPSRRLVLRMETGSNVAASRRRSVVASVTALYLGRVWRDVLHSVLTWAGIGGLWLWVYYFLNLTLILREGFAV